VKTGILAENHGEALDEVALLVGSARWTALVTVLVKGAQPVQEGHGWHCVAGGHVLPRQPVPAAAQDDDS
jgi:hypothetical protein